MSDNTNNNTMANTSGTKSAKSNTANTSTTPKGTKSTPAKTGTNKSTKSSTGPSTAESLAAALNAAAEHQRAGLTLGSNTKKNLLTAKGSKPQQSGSNQGSTSRKHNYEGDKEDTAEGTEAMTDTAGGSDVSANKCHQLGGQVKEKHHMEARNHLVVPEQDIEMGDETTPVKKLDKGKGKEKEVDPPEVYSVKMSKAKKRGTGQEVPDIKLAEPTEANTLRHNTDKAIEEVTMGYALMTVIDDETDEWCDMGYVTHLCASIGLRGLQNKVIWNAMILAVPPAAVDQSLLQGIQLGAYKNTIKWSKDAGNLEASFLNGNHQQEVLKLLEVKEMHMQYKRATQERKNAANYDKEQKYLLDEAWEKSMKVLDASGCWLVHFVDKDDDNAKLYQVPNILATLTGEEQEEYLEQELYMSVMKLLHLEHFQAKKKGKADAGSTAQQLESWVPLLGGLQLQLCEYVLDVFTFLAALIKVPTVTSTIETAKLAEYDVEKTGRAYGLKMLSRAKASPDFEWDVVNDFAEVAVEIWGDVTKMSGHDYPWHLWGLEDAKSSELWEELVEKYWCRVSSKATDLGHEISLNANTQNPDKVKVTLQNKLQWVREGWLHEPHLPKAFTSIPLGNWLMFNNVQ
ncbi:hypothetical protein EDC04DRAFT_3024820 [Pisolithus marmoratus]|nr:hypothetical protein EDC04DRAFT_3024820 [Pisolithus marmoratus]